MGGKCLSCAASDNRRLDSLTGRCIALLMYYDNMTMVCVPCAAGCLTCSSSSLCVSCLPGFFLSGSLCSDVCPNRTFKNIAAQVCQVCPYDCLTCKADGTCFTCNIDDFRQLDLVTLRCYPTPGYYESFQRASNKCNSNCSQCKSDNYCTKCANNYYLTATNQCLM